MEMVRRNELGQVVGSGFAFHNYNEQESYFDYKVSHVRFPSHDNKKASKVTTYKIGSNGELIKMDQ